MAKKLYFTSGRLPARWILPARSYTLTRALGGGFESGRFHTLWGPKASTKSTNALYMIAEAQKLDIPCYYIDAEKTYDESYAEKCGVDVDALRLMYKGVNIAETLLEAVIPEMQENAEAVFVIDSLSSVTLSSFFDKSESNPMGIYSRSAKFVLSKLLNELDRGHMIFLISHASMDLSGHIPMLTAQMGSAQSHWVSNIIKFNALNGKDHFREDGFRRIKWNIEKSKQPVWPFQGEYYFKGTTAEVDRIAEIVEVGKELDIITGSTWLTLGAEKYHGNTALTEALREDVQLLEMLSEAITVYDEQFRSSLTTVVEPGLLEQE